MPTSRHDFDREQSRASRGGREGAGYPNLCGSSGAICLRLNTGWAVGVFTAIVLLCAAALLIETIEIAGSQTLAASMKLSSLSRANSLWPGNPEAHYRLGMLRLSLPDQANSAEAVKDLRRATELGPVWVRYWGLLAWACESSGDVHCADEAMGRIQKLAPMDPEAISLLANYYLASDRPGPALEQFGRLLRIAPEHNRDVFRICTSAGYSLAQLEQQFLESGPAVALDYLAYLTEHGQRDSARELWKDLVRRAGNREFSLSAASVAPYINRLLGAGFGEDAEHVRRDLTALKVFDGQQVAEGNLVFNGDFEHRTSNDIFDWRKVDSAYPIVNFAAGEAYSGKRCLRVEFTVGLNEDYLLAYQFLPLQPNTHYRLSAYVRSDRITSDSGPRLQIYDPLCRTCLEATSESTVGTTPWHEISIAFSTGPGTQLGKLELIRSRGRVFPTDITGTFWLDNVWVKEEHDHSETGR